MIDYIILIVKDVVNIKNELVDNLCELGLFGVKGVGELILVGGVLVYVNVIENVFGIKINKIFIMLEFIMEVIVNE